MTKKIITFFKKDIVLTISFFLAILSCTIVPISLEYLDYIDFKTLVLLFSLMIIIEGFREENLFQYIGNEILKKVNSKRGIIFTLVFLCFLSSMFITNDVALITFVPFGIMILETIGLTNSLCLTITLMTIAANLGSMFTPIGNPQNLYLFSMSSLSFKDFLELMFPYILIAAILLIVFIFFGYNKSNFKVELKTSNINNKRLIYFYSILFILCLLTVIGIINYIILFAIVFISILIKNKELLRKADYSLLLTFLFFFIFVGNINHIDSFHKFIINILANNEKMFSILLSQAISNVPAAMLLSSYTNNINDLIIGTNIGGLGTLIASMASLISYKQLCTKYPNLKNKYLSIFTLCNIAFLLIYIIQISLS
ncbi:MAG: anion permease [Clostridium sp.]|nr:anion permease [Clostridium sp.]